MCVSVITAKCLLPLQQNIKRFGYAFQLTWNKI